MRWLMQAEGSRRLEEPLGPLGRSDALGRRWRQLVPQDTTGSATSPKEMPLRMNKQKKEI
jgi:hypothetical protein